VLGWSTLLYGLWPAVTVTASGLGASVVLVAFGLWLLIAGRHDGSRGDSGQPPGLVAWLRRTSRLQLIAVGSLPVLALVDLTHWWLPSVICASAIHVTGFTFYLRRLVDAVLPPLMWAGGVTGLVMTSSRYDWTVVWAISGAVAAVVTSVYGSTLVCSRRRTPHINSFGAAGAAHLEGGPQHAEST
jgi:hypothetical protein